jgi:hypothetical protein
MTASIENIGNEKQPASDTMKKIMKRKTNNENWQCNDNNES